MSVFVPHLLLCWWTPPPPPEVCTRASVCADVEPLWNVQHSPDSHLPNRCRGFPPVPPARRRCRPPGSCHRDPHPLPGWASSGAPLEGEPEAELRVVETSPAPHPQGSGCTRFLLRRRRHSPRLGPRSEGEETP